MATYEYDDFRVAFTREADDRYTVVSTSEDGQRVTSAFMLPMTVEHLEHAVVALSRSGTREVASAVVESRVTGEEVGGQLATALFDSSLGPFFDQAQNRATENGRGLRLTLSLALTPELLSVPWELLYRRPTFLASQRRSPVVRYLELGARPAPQRIDGPVRILGVVASPRGVPQLDVASERARVEAALSAMIGLGRVALEWCDPATPRSLRSCLRDGTFHVLHYIGHSSFDDDGEGRLLLCDEDGGPAPVSESVLTNLLGDQTSLRLAVLNSCEGARSTLTDPFAGIATSLVALGVPAVVAMQFSISDRAAIVFAEELFTSLIGRQYPIDASVSEARKAVFTEVNEIEWATPVLFLRSDDGRLFDFATQPAALPAPRAAGQPDGDTSPKTGAEDSTTTTSPAQPHRAGPRWRRPVVAVVAIVAVVSAVIGVLVAVSGDDGEATATTLDGVTTDAPRATVEVATTTVEVATTSPAAVPIPTDSSVEIATTTVTSTAVDTVPTPQCDGQSPPERPGAPALTGEQLAAFEVFQQWVDLVASAKSGAGDDELFQRMGDLYENQTTHFMTVEKLEAGYSGMEADHLVDPTVVSESPLTFRLVSLVYDNATASTPCRTRLLCVTATSADRLIESYEWTLKPEHDYDGAWISASALARFKGTSIDGLREAACP